MERAGGQSPGVVPRDLLSIAIPNNYSSDDDPGREPLTHWRGHANLLYSNWINYSIYETTPYDIMQIPEGGTPPPQEWKDILYFTQRDDADAMSGKRSAHGLFQSPG